MAIGEVAIALGVIKYGLYPVHSWLENPMSRVMEGCSPWGRLKSWHWFV